MSRHLRDIYAFYATEHEFVFIFKQNSSSATQSELDPRARTTSSRRMRRRGRSLVLMSKQCAHLLLIEVVDERCRSRSMRIVDHGFDGHRLKNTRWWRGCARMLNQRAKSRVNDAIGVTNGDGTGRLMTVRTLVGIRPWMRCIRMVARRMRDGGVMHGADRHDQSTEQAKAEKDKCALHVECDE